MLDEVHERELITDFLLIVIRDAIKMYPHLKVIIMSATLDSEKFSKYFDDCPVVNVPGRMFNVDIIHLDDILIDTGYETDEMTSYMNTNEPPDGELYEFYLFVFIIKNLVNISFSHI